MTNPIPYIRNKFCFWLTGLTHDEIANLIDKVNEVADNKAEENDYVSKSDFDPDDYDFSPLNDYDFSEFLTNDNIDEQIECFLSNNNYCTSDYVEEQVKDAINDLPDYAKLEPFDTAITEIKNRLDALEKKGKKKKKKESKPE
jgi:hypothetical protein